LSNEANIPERGMEPPEERRRGRNPIRQPTEEAREVFSKIGIDIDDVDSLRELAADLYFIRRMRQNHQTRVTMTWTSTIAAIVSAVIGGAAVIVSNLIHTKGTP
jgi:hypothetical protein